MKTEPIEWYNTLPDEWKKYIDVYFSDDKYVKKKFFSFFSKNAKIEYLLSIQSETTFRVFAPLYTLTPISYFTNLEFININATNISSIKPLSKCRKLTCLNIDNSTNKIDDWAYLNLLINLEQLILFNSTGSFSLINIEKLTSLKFLSVTNLKNQNYTILQNFNKMRILSLESCDISDLDFVYNMPNLEELRIEYTLISEATILEFKRKRPNVIIIS